MITSYYVRFRKRDGMQSPWELYIDKNMKDRFSLKKAQEIADQLWDEGNETTMTGVGTDWDNIT